MSDRIAVMNEGRVEQIGTPEEIYHSPASVFVANFIGVANLLPATVVGVMDQTCVATVGGATRMEAARPLWDAKPGSKATLMVRPERLHLGVPGGGLPAVLETAVFQGPVIRCLLRTQDGIEVVAHVGSEGARPELVAGRTYALHWDADAARLLPPARAPIALDQNSRTTIELASQQ